MESVSKCGWNFGRNKLARIDDTNDFPEQHSLVCQKCFPDEFTRLKTAALHDLRVQNGE